MLLTRSQVNHRIETQQLIQRSTRKTETIAKAPVLTERINPVKTAIEFVKKHLAIGMVITTTALTIGCSEPQTEQEYWRSVAWRNSPLCRQRINDATIVYQRLKGNTWERGYLTSKISVEQFHEITDALLADLRRKQDLIYHDHITLLRKEIKPQ